MESEGNRLAIPRCILNCGAFAALTPPAAADLGRPETALRIEGHLYHAGSCATEKVDAPALVVAIDLFHTAAEVIRLPLIADKDLVWERAELSPRRIPDRAAGRVGNVLAGKPDSRERAELCEIGCRERAHLLFGEIRPPRQRSGMAVKVAFANVIETAGGHPIALVIGDEELILRAHADAAGRTKAGRERLEMSGTIGAVDPSLPEAVVGHVAAAFAGFLSVRDGKLSSGAKVDRGILAAERVYDRAIVIFMVLPRIPKGVGDALVAIAFPIPVGIHQSGQFRLLRDVVGLLLRVVIDAVRLHQVFREEGPDSVLVFPDLAFPGSDGECAIGLVTETKHGDRAARKRDSFKTISGRYLGRGRAEGTEKNEK